MDLFERLLCAGVFPGSWFAGYALVRRLAGNDPSAGRLSCALAPAAGLLLGTPVLLGAVLLEARAPEVIGFAGWAASAWFAQGLRRWPQAGREEAMRSGWPQAMAIAVVAFLINAAYSGESVFVGRDQAVYANQGLHIAREGSLTIPYPLASFEAEYMDVLGPLYAATGLYTSSGEMEVQFSPVLPIWLAQAFHCFGYAGLFSVNAMAASFSVLLFHGLAYFMAGRRTALWATAFFAFNPAQIWISRITLSEVFAQHVFLAGALAFAWSSRRRRRWLATLGGLLTGSMAFVRIDGFVLAPIAFAGFTLALCGAQHRGTGGGRPTIEQATCHAAGTLFSLLLAWGLYKRISTHYFEALEERIQLIVVATAACAALTVLFMSLPVLRRLAGRALKMRVVWIGFSAGLVGTALYAGLVRPHMEPYGVYDDPGFSLYGERDYREEALPNLACYLSIPVILLAIAVLPAALRRALRNPAFAGVLPLGLAGFGFSCLYLWNPSISYDHIWAVRRFVPIVIPAFILFAFLGLKWFLLLRPARWIFRFGMNAMGLSLLAYAAYGAQPFLFLKEYRGSVAFVEAVNAALPEDRLIFGDISSRLMVPLAIGWSRPIVRVDLERTRDLMAMEEIVSRYREGNDSLYLLTDQPWQTPGKYKRKTEFAFQYPLIKPTARPPAREILRHSYRLVLYECEESISLTNFDRINLGAMPVIGVEQGGFYGQEQDAEGSFRWTDGRAWLRIPIRRDYLPESLHITALAFKSGGTLLKVRADGELVFERFLTKTREALTIPLEDRDYGESVLIELESDTFVPAAMSDSEDTRLLGLRLRYLALWGDFGR